MAGEDDQNINNQPPNPPPPTQQAPHNCQIKILPPKSAEEILARERERKARTTLLMALPKDHLARFHNISDAKEMWDAIKTRFGGNAKNTGGQAEEEEEDHALMTFNSNSSSNEVQSCYDKCVASYVKLKKLYDEQREQLGDASIEIQAYTQALKKVEAQLVAHTNPKSTLVRGKDIVVNKPKVVCEPKVWFDAPIIEEYESDSKDEHVSLPTKEQEIPSFAFINTDKACKNSLSKTVIEQKHMPNVKTGRVNVNPVRPRVNIGSSNVNTVRSRQPVPTKTSNSFSPKRPQVNQLNQRRHFSKSHSPVSRPIVRNTARMTYSHAVKGNWGTAVKTSAVDMVINPPWNLPFLGAKGLTSPEQTATGVNTPGSDENSLKLYDLIADMKGC
ncbi:hypothetical protein Tco_1091979 [Tanacetum coccineum]|uniref:Xylulose kinase-1 n=1 Tax=Tanacetum coccineum TaxID=301880 RepID=A0ABQ5I9R7_9ASTR